MKLINGGSFDEAIRQRQSEVAEQGLRWEQFVANFLVKNLPSEYEVFLKPQPSRSGKAFCDEFSNKPLE